MEIRFVYITAAGLEQAKEIGRKLVTSRLAACVNIFERMHSIYLWEGELQEAAEAVLMAKTTRDRVEALTEKVRTLHGYAVPCIVSIPIDGGNHDFLSWIAGEVQNKEMEQS
jgi:periplasmic divalent cation tolerance protein